MEALALKDNAGILCCASCFGSSYGRGLLLNSLFFSFSLLHSFMAIRKVGRNACLRLLVPIVFTGIASTGWKLFSAGSPESFSAHGSLSTAACVGCKLLELLFVYAQAAAVSSSVLVFLFMPFYCLRQGNIVGRIISFPCATATKRPVCKSKSCESLAQTGYDSYCKPQTSIGDLNNESQKQLQK